MISFFCALCHVEASTFGGAQGTASHALPSTPCPDTLTGRGRHDWRMVGGGATLHRVTRALASHAAGAACARMACGTYPSARSHAIPTRWEVQRTIAGQDGGGCIFFGSDTCGNIDGLEKYPIGENMACRLRTYQPEPSFLLPR